MFSAPLHPSGMSFGLLSSPRGAKLPRFEPLMDEIPIGDWGSGPVAISGREHQPRAEGDRRPKESREGGGSEQRREEQGRADLRLRGAEGSGPGVSSSPARGRPAARCRWRPAEVLRPPRVPPTP